MSDTDPAGLASVILAAELALPDGEINEEWAAHIAAAVIAWMQAPPQVDRMASEMCWEHEGKDNAPFSFADDPVREWWNCRPDVERGYWAEMAVAAIAALAEKPND